MHNLHQWWCDVCPTFNSAWFGKDADLKRCKRIVFALCIALLSLNWCSFLCAIIYKRLQTWCLLQLVVFTQRAWICPGPPWCRWWHHSRLYQHVGEGTLHTDPAKPGVPYPPGELPPDRGHWTKQRIQIRDLSALKRFTTCVANKFYFHFELLVM